MFKYYLRSSFPTYAGPRSNNMFIRYKRIDPNDIPRDVTSGVANPEIARVLSNILGFEVHAERLVIAPSNDSIVYVAKYTGPKIPKGATAVPSSGYFEFFEVTTRKVHCYNCGDFPTHCTNCSHRRWFAGQNPN